MKTALTFNVRSMLGTSVTNATRLTSVLAFTAIVSGCAGVSRVPSDAFQAADIAIANAEKEQASDFAPSELNAAREKMASARIAMAKNPREQDIVRARRLAEAAQSDAEFASARARDGRAYAVNADLQKNNETLREELQRQAGALDKGESQ